MTRSHLALMAALCSTLAACGGVVPPPATQIGRPQPLPYKPGPPASAFTRPGPLVGSDARHLIQMFGQPRLDIRESSMRKLQFANGRCVLDAYLYVPPQGKEPLVTHVDARTLTGMDTDPAACAAALQAK